MSGLYVVSNGGEYFISTEEESITENPTCEEDEASINEITAIGNHLSEYLNCFQLFGYDSHGRPVKLTRISSYMENAAINGLIMDDIENQEREKWSSMDIAVDDDDEERQ